MPFDLLPISLRTTASLGSGRLKRAAQQASVLENFTSGGQGLALLNRQLVMRKFRMESPQGRKPLERWCISQAELDALVEADRKAREGFERLPEICKRFGISQSTAHIWRKHGTARRKRLTEKRDPRDPKYFLYSIKEFEEASAPTGPPLDQFTDEIGRAWLWVNVASERYRIPRSPLLVWSRPGGKGCPFLKGKILDRRERGFIWGSNRSATRVFLLESEVKAAATARVTDLPIDPDQLSAKQAAAAPFRFPIAFCSRFAARQHPLLKRKISAGWRELVVNGRIVRERWFSRDHLSRLAKLRDNRPNLRTKNGLSGPEAKILFGLHPASLRYWWKHGCNFVDGGKLDARRIWMLEPGNRTHQVLVYPVSQLQQIAARLKSGSEGIWIDKKGNRWLVQRRAMRDFRLHAFFLTSYRNQGCPLLMGQKLRDAGSHVAL